LGNKISTKKKKKKKKKEGVSCFNDNKHYRNICISFSETLVAFSARMSHDMSFLKDHQILIFDELITNQGNHYNHRIGLFQLSILTSPGSYVTVQIAKNNQGEAWAFAMDPTNSSSGGTMVVLYLQPGDAVYAKVNGHQHDNTYQTITKIYTSFSGFLIRN
jgi:hypothetical protein